MKKQIDIHQTSLNIDLWIEIKHQKQNRKNDLKNYSSYFLNHQTSLDNLIKLTYDITDKDFEYFYAYILEQEHYENIKVLWGENDNGVDIKAEKDGKVYLIQCKQWADLSIDIQKVGMIYTRMYHEKYTYKDSIIRIVTTSFFDKFSREFLNWNNIEFIDNKKLLQLCEEKWYLKDEKWKDIRIWIYKKRLENLKNLKSQLEFEMKREARNHIPQSKRLQVGFTKSSESLDYYWKLFQYWDLV